MPCPFVFQGTIMFPDIVIVKCAFYHRYWPFLVLGGHSLSLYLA